MSTIDYPTTINAVSWTLGALIILMCLVRIWGRVFLLDRPGWDDLLMALAAASAITSSALVTVSVRYGVGTHIDSIHDPVTRSLAVKYTIIAPVFSIAASTFAKLSVIVFLIRLMGMVATRRHIVTAWALCVVLVALNIFAIVIIVCYCVPPAAQWDPSIKGKCIDYSFQIIVADIQSGYNAFIDFLVAVLPTLIIRKLNINLKMKISLCGLMGGAAFGAVATIVKIVTIKNSDHVDITWAWAPVTLWYTAEMDLIIIFGTIPALWPVVRWFMHRNEYGAYSDTPYRNAFRSPDHPDGSEAYQLSGCRSNTGVFTRALREVDNMTTG
ncbi:hypothetical protein GQX73_g4915 [Xylaria multiplex]|uniref:Rhodopsin domain-containing protein n=1 Tax=Xylaria multiplex TaxID=323545 RepID=A0A7C8MMA6_9PEZI|nr:hypothetical protein GQX73_g4915 [Xylaria multiplex]